MELKNFPPQLLSLWKDDHSGQTFFQEESFGKNVQLEFPENQKIFHVRLAGPQSNVENKKESLRVKLQANTHYTYVEIQNDSGSSSLEVQLAGAHARAELFGLIDLKQKQKADWQWEVKHLVPQTSSEQYVKTILQDDGQVDFRGKIYIAPKAQQTDAKQLNKNLLLSKKAKCISRPELEIFADDVKCGHGLTTSQFREDELFYLQARGIRLEVAKNFLAQAFVKDILQKVPEIYISKLKRIFPNL